jgi:hypothetical protein
VIGPPRWFPESSFEPGYNDGNVNDPDDAIRRTLTMRHSILALAGVVLACLAAVLSLAQPSDQSGPAATAPQSAPVTGLAQLLTNAAVREDLGFTEQQTEQLKGAFEDFNKNQPQRPNLEGLSNGQRRQKIEQYQQEATRQAEQLGRQLAQILTREQQDQLRQIGFRITAYVALGDAQVAQQLRLSQEQQEKLQQIREETQRQIWRFQDQAAKQSLEVLSAEQLTRLRNLHEQGFRQQAPATAPPQARPNQPQR